MLGVFHQELQLYMVTVYSSSMKPRHQATTAVLVRSMYVQYLLNDDDDDAWAGYCSHHNVLSITVPVYCRRLGMYCTL